MQQLLKTDNLSSKIFTYQMSKLSYYVDSLEYKSPGYYSIHHHLFVDRLHKTTHLTYK